MHIQNLVLLLNLFLTGYAIYAFYKKIILKKTDCFLEKWYLLHLICFIFFVFREFGAGRMIGYGKWDYFLTAMFSFLFSLSFFYYRKKQTNYYEFWVGSMISLISSILIMQFIYIWSSTESKILFKFSVWEW
jgi:hypothetical protein